MSPVILITGTSGFSGGYIYQYLRKQGYATHSHWGRAVSDLSSSRTYSTWLTEWDVRPDIIVHTADCSPDTEVTINDIYKNVISTHYLTEYAKKANVKKIIYLSSDSIYGVDTNRPILKVDSNIINPSFYGHVKFVCEMGFKASGIPTVALRLPLVVGPGARRNWLVRVVNNVKEGKPVTIHNPLREFNNLIHIQNLSELIVNLIEHPHANDFEIILPASIGTLPIQEVVNRIVQNRVPIIINEEPIPGGPIDGQFYIHKHMWTTEKALNQFIEDVGLKQS